MYFQTDPESLHVVLHDKESLIEQQERYLKALKSI